MLARAAPVMGDLVCCPKLLVDTARKKHYAKLDHDTSKVKLCRGILCTHIFPVVFFNKSYIKFPVNHKLISGEAASDLC